MYGCFLTGVAVIIISASHIISVRQKSKGVPWKRSVILHTRENINEKNLYEQYKKLINSCKIDIFVSGIVDEGIENIIKENENIKKLQDRIPEYNKIEISAKKSEKENAVQESMEVTQGKLVIGMDLDVDNEDFRYDIMIYNSIFGGSKFKTIPKCTWKGKFGIYSKF